jgi:hypothetical protein
MEKISIKEKSIFDLTPLELRSKWSSTEFKEEKFRVHWHPGSKFLLAEQEISKENF